MYIEHFLLDLIANCFNYFNLELFTDSFFPYRKPQQKTFIRMTFLCVIVIISSIPNVPYLSQINILVAYLYLVIISNLRLKASFAFFVKYLILISIITLICFLFCALVTVNPSPTVKAAVNIFYKYQKLAATFLVYIVLNLHINAKRLKKLNIKTIYPLAFSVLSMAVVFLLLFSNYLFIKFDILMDLLPYFYTFVIGILILSLNIYRKTLETLEQQTMQKLLVKKYEMELEYFNNIENSLTTLSRIRHDFKNSLIALDVYAEQNRVNELRTYIAELNKEIVSTKIIETPSPLISSILTTKYTICQGKNIKLNLDINFEKIFIPDLYIVTIMGNILDNAITAASHTSNGIIEFSILQVENYLEILCKNNYTGSIKEKNSNLISTKENENILHGFGVLNIKDSVNELNGKLNIQYDTQQFVIEILLPNYRKS